MNHNHFRFFFLIGEENISLKIKYWEKGKGIPTKGWIHPNGPKPKILKSDSGPKTQNSSQEPKTKPNLTLISHHQPPPSHYRPPPRSWVLNILYFLLYLFSRVKIMYRKEGRKVCNVSMSDTLITTFAI